MPENNQEIETWKPVTIAPFSDCYEVSNLGNVRSIACVTRLSLAKIKKRARVLKPYKNHQGYLTCALSKVTKKVVFVHRLVALAFIDNPDNKATVNHKNGIITDNNVKNLEWASYSENHLHAYKVLGRKASNAGKFGSSSNRAKPVVQLSKDGEKFWMSIIDATKELFGSPGTICNACRGRRASAYGFKWRYATETEIAQLKKSEGVS